MTLRTTLTTATITGALALAGCGGSTPTPTPTPTQSKPAVSKVEDCATRMYRDQQRSGYPFEALSQAQRDRIYASYLAICDKGSA